MKALHCPRCGTHRVHRSRRRSRLERILGLTGGSVHRCHECNVRVLQIGSCIVPVSTLDRVSKAASLAAVLLIATLVIVAVIVWFGHVNFLPA